MIRAMCLAGVGLCLVLAASPAQAADEVGPLVWNLPPARMVQYQVVTLKGGKPTAEPPRKLTLFGSELTPRKGESEHSIAVADYRDLALHFLFVLPDAAVKPGQKWAYTRIFFERGQEAFPTGLSLLWGDKLDPVIVQGQYRFKGLEKIDGRELATFEGAFTVGTVKKGALGKELGTLKTWQHVDPAGPALIRARYELVAKGEEIQDIRHGFMRTSVRLNQSEQLDLTAGDRELSHEVLSKGINDAIQAGTRWLLAQQKPNGVFKEDQAYSEEFPIGSTSLVLMALLHSGVKADDPVIAKSFDYIRKASSKQHTYDAALLIQAVEAKYLPFEKLEDVKHFNEAQARQSLQQAISPEDRALVEDAAKWLIAQQGRGGTWGYPEYNDTGFDNSNTQYALLGLKSAARCGVKIEPEVYKKIVKHFLDNQITTGEPRVELAIDWEWEEEGETIAKGGEQSPRPWGYAVTALRPAERGYAAMTCAGLTSLIVAESELFALGKLDATMRGDLARAKREGLAWLQANWSPRVSTPASGYWTTFYHYYLYSVERVGVLYGIKRLGGHDWYLEGAQLLLDTQLADGHWVGDDMHPLTDTAFALLFLKKATMRVLTK